MKIILVCLVALNIFKVTYSEVSVRVYEPLRFKNYNIRSIEEDMILGEGVFEISTNDIENDKGKKIVIRFPEKGLMTNKKKWIKIDKYFIENKNKEILITREIEHIKFYAFLDRRKINKGESGEIVEGEYVGKVPVIFSLYSQEIGEK
ncbi:MAG: hypothetical protein RR523_04795 [Cetobacterium sp.]|uniref:hypothetical protein n=1 Tax=Cetobacterium sp. TaxID=2071632 RepID=UPI002FC61C7E